MSGMNENIDNIAREKLFHFEAQPPKDVWNKIESDLDVRKRRGIPTFFRVAAVLMIAAGFTGLVLKFMPKQEEKNLQANKIPRIEKNKNVISTPVIKKEKEYAYNAIRTRTSPNEVKQHVPELKSEAPNRIVSDSKPTKPSHQFTVVPSKKLKKEVPSKLTSKEILVPTLKDSLQKTSLPGKNLDKLADLSAAVDTANQGNQPEKEFQQNDVEANKSPHKNTDIIAALSQPDDEKMTHNLKWAISAMGGPQYSGRFLDAGKSSSQNAKVEGVMAYAGGLQVEVKPASRFSIQTGLCYSKIGQINSASVMSQTNNTETLYDYGKDNPTVINNGNGKVDIRNRNVVNANNTNIQALVGTPATQQQVETPNALIEQYFGFVELPLLMKYRIIDRKKLNVIFTGGLWTNFLVQNSAYLVEGSKTTPGKSSDVRTVNYSSSLGLGVSYPIISSISFSVEPTFRYYLNPIYSIESYNVRPYSFGIMTGLTYSFDR